jgi:hypothetical protein
MAKSSEKTRIRFEYEGKPYCLEYNAASLKKLERSGVSLSKLSDMVVSAPEVIFRGAFYANHPDVSERKIKEIFKALKRTADEAEPEYDDDGNVVDMLNVAMSEMLKEAIDEITGRGGNVGWTVTK